MANRVEINPSEWFFVTDKVILVEEYESIIGNTVKLGIDRSQPVYMFTFKGKLNNKDEQDEQDEVTVILPLQAAWDLFNNVLNGFELFKKVNEEK